jgi:hypothetical protein
MERQTMDCYNFITNENDIITTFKSLATEMRKQVDANGNFGAQITLTTYDFVFAACIAREPRNFSMFIYDHGILQFTIFLLSKGEENPIRAILNAEQFIERVSLNGLRKCITYSFQYLDRFHVQNAGV